MFLVLTAIVLMLIMQSIYYITFFNLSKESASKYTKDIMNKVEQNIDSIAQKIEKDAYTISYNKYVQELLVSDDNVRNVELKGYTTDLFSYIISSNGNIYDIILMNNQDRQISMSYTYQYDILSNLERDYDFKDPQLKTPIFTPVIRDRIQAFQYYAYIFPVFSTMDQEKSYEKIGTCIFLLDIRSNW